MYRVLNMTFGRHGFNGNEGMCFPGQVSGQQGEKKEDGNI